MSPRLKISVIAFLAPAMFFLAVVKTGVTVSGNESSRLAAVQCLVEFGDFSIDHSDFGTVDKAFVNGKFYSDKPPFYTMWLSLVYSALRSCFHVSFTDGAGICFFVINFLGSAVFAVGTAALCLFCLRRRAVPFVFALPLSLGLALATPLLSYGVIINNHVPAAFFLLLLFTLLDLGDESPSPPLFFAAGCAAGALFNIELPTGLIAGAAAGFYIITSGRGKVFPPLLCFCAAFGIFAGGLALFDLSLYGSVLPVYMIPGAYDFEGNIHSAGAAGLRAPLSFPGYLWDITFGARGIFSGTPALLFAFPAFFSRGFWASRLNLCFAGAAAALILFYAVFTGDYGGWAYGFRFLLPLVPLFWIWGSVWLFGQKRRPVLRKLFLAAAVFGFIIAALGACNPFPVCYEGASSRPGSVDARFKYPPFANLLCLTAETMPGSAADGALRKLAGDPRTVDLYLAKAFANMRKPDGMSCGLSAFLHSEKVLSVLAALLSSAALLAGFLALGAAASAVLFRFAPEGAGFLPVPLLSFVILCAVTAVCGYAGALFPLALLSFAFLLFFAARRFAGPGGPGRAFVFSPGFLILAAAPAALHICASAFYLCAAPADWDAMTYHLFMPCQWALEGRIFHIPSVFGDNAPAFAPPNWSLFNAFFLSFLGGDFFAGPAGGLFLLFGAVCAGRIARLCGADSAASGMVTALFLCCPPFFLSAYSACADIPSLALLLGGLMWLLDYNKKRSALTLALSVLSLSAAAGMKNTALVFAAPLLAWIILWTLFRRKPFLAVLLCFLSVLAGGWHYILNTVLYGSPLFPAELALGPFVVFRGAYGMDGLVSGEFHSSSVFDLAERIFRTDGPAVAVIFLSGLAAFAARGRRGGASLIALAVCVLWALEYIFLIPHNTETRFMFPALALGLAGFGLLLSGPAALRNLVFGAALAVFLLSDVSALAIHFWGFPLTPVIFAGALLTALTVSVMLFMAGRSVLKAVLIFALLCAALAFASLAEPGLRELSLARTDYRFWSGAWELFNSPAADKLPPVTIAYTGFNVPHTVAGPSLRNRVFYCNVQGPAERGFYDFWMADGKKRYDYHKPGIYRDKPDFKQWLRNLRSGGADFLVTAVMSPAERKYLASTTEGFPMEDKWASENPEIFKPVSETDFARIYEIDGPALEAAAGPAGE